MSLHCLAVADRGFDRIILEALANSRKIASVENFLASDYNFDLIGKIPDLIVLGIDRYGDAIFAVEKMGVAMPQSRIAFVFDAERSMPYLFLTMMQKMVHRMIPVDELDTLNLTINEIYSEAFHAVRREVSDIQCSARELNLLRLLQLGLESDEIATILGVSSATLTRYICDCLAKFGVKNRSALIARSFRVFGDLAGETKILAEVR